MHPDLIKLAEADALDRELKALKKQKADAEAELAGARAAVERAEAERTELDAALKGNKARQRELNREIETYESRKQSAVRVLESGAGDPDAAERQIASVAGILDGLETEVLERMDLQESQEADLAARTRALDAARADLARLEVEVPATIERLRAAWDALVPQRDAVLEGLDRLTRQRYVDLRDRKGSAVAPVAGDSCQACHQFVQPQIVADLKRGLIEPCRGCGRWLIVPDA